MANSLAGYAAEKLGIGDTLDAVRVVLERCTATPVAALRHGRPAGAESSDGLDVSL